MNISYVHPQPRWRVTGVDGGTVEFNDGQMVSRLKADPPPAQEEE